MIISNYEEYTIFIFSISGDIIIGNIFANLQLYNHLQPLPNTTDKQLVYISQLHKIYTDRRFNHVGNYYLFFFFYINYTVHLIITLIRNRVEPKTTVIIRTHICRRKVGQLYIVLAKLADLNREIFYDFILLQCYYFLITITM